MQRLRVGLCYDTFADFTWQAGDPADADAEFEPRTTVEALALAIEACGFTPVDIGPAHALRERLCSGLTLDAAVNIAESAHSRNREAYVPILLEMAGIPCLGSDALTLSLSLDKAWTKDLVHRAGVPTPPYLSIADPADVEADGLPAPFPLFVKPRYEGTSKGITAESKVHSPEALQDAVARVVDRYRQPALVEKFIEGGGEFTVAVTGHAPPEALPALQRATETTTGIGLHALEHRGMPAAAWGHDLNGTLHPALEATLQHQALTVFETLECRDFARADFRVDGNGRVWFLEINPLPSFAPDDTFAIIAELMDISYEAFLADVLRRGFERIGLD